MLGCERRATRKRCAGTLALSARLGGRGISGSLSTTSPSTSATQSFGEALKVIAEERDALAALVGEIKHSHRGCSIAPIPAPPRWRR